MRLMELGYCEMSKEITSAMGRDQEWAGPLSLIRTDHAEPSLFQPESLLREARRQRGLDEGQVPAVCLLDPDGDVVRYLQQTGRGHRSESWACFHTGLWETEVERTPLGIVGNAVEHPSPSWWPRSSSPPDAVWL